MAKVLVVDDSDNMRAFIRTTVESSGHEVIEASDGVEGLNAAKAHPDLKLIVTDYNMPNMDGIAMCKAIREVPAFKDIPMLMLTTEGSTSLKELGKQAGVLAWITKPFTPDRLTLVIGKIFSK